MTERLVIGAEVEAREVQRGFRQIADSAATAMRAVERSAANLSGIDTATRSARALNSAFVDAVRTLGEMGRELGSGLNVADVGAFRALVTEQRALAAATKGADIELDQLNASLRALDAGNVNAAAQALLGLRRAQREWAREGTAGSVRLQAEYQRERQSAEQAAAARLRAANAAERAAADELRGRRQVRAELMGDVRTLGLYGRAVDGTNQRAVAAWRAEAAAIRTQAREVGLAREQVLKLDAVVRRTEQGFQRQAAAAARLRGEMGGLGSVMRGIGPIGLGLGGALSAREVIQYADAWTNAGNRIRSVTDSLDEARAMQGALFAVAQDTRSSFSDTVDLYARLGQSSERLGLSQGDLLDLTTLVNQSIALSGASAQAAEGALTQLAQSFGLGQLRGEELNSVLSATPRLAKALADGLGVTVDQLKRMGEAGELTSQVVARGLLGQGEKIAAEYARITPTIAASFTVLNNEIGKLIGEQAESTGASRAMASAITLAARNVDVLAAALLGVGAVATARLLAGYIASLRVMVATQTAAAVTARTAALGVASLGTAGTAAAVGLGAARTALALVGGPIGLAVIGTLGAIAVAFDAQGKGAREAAAETDEFRQSLIRLSETQVQETMRGVIGEMATLQAEAARIRREMDEGRSRMARTGVSFGTGAPGAIVNTSQDALRATDAALARLQGRYDALTEAQERFRAAGTGRPSNSLNDEVQLLSDLARLGGADAAHKQRIAEIIRQTNAEMAKLPATSEKNAEADRRRIVLLQRIETLTGASRKLGTIDTGDADAALRAFSERADATLLRLDAARVLGATGAEQAAMLADVAAAERAVTAEIERRGGARAADIAAVRDLIALRDRLRDVGPVLPPITAVVDRVELGDIALPALTLPSVLGPPRNLDAIVADLERRAAALGGARIDVEIATAVGDTAALAEAEARVEEITRGLRAARTAALVFVRALPGGAQAAAMERLGSAAGDVAESVRDAGDALRAVGNGVRGVLQIADAFGDVDESVRRSVDGLAGLISGIGDAQGALAALGKGAGIADLFKSGAGLSSIVSIVGGALGLLSGINGILNKPDPVVAAAREATRANTEELAKVRFQLSGFRSSLSNLGGASAAARTVTRDSELLTYLRRINMPGGAGSFGDAIRRQAWTALSERDTSAVDAQLRTLGFTLADLDQIAEQYGITLLKDGRLLATGLTQFADRLDLAREAALRWEQGLSGALSRQSFARDIFDIDPQTAAGMQRVLDDSVALFREFAPELYDRIFGKLDLTTDVGRNQADLNIQAIAREFLSDEFRQGRGWLFEALKDSDLLDSPEFMTLLLGSETALDAFAATVEDTAARLQDSFGGIRRLQGVRSTLFDLDGPMAAWDDAVDIARKLLPPQIADAIASFNIDSREGQEAAREYLRGLFTQFESGELDAILKATGLEFGEFLDFLMLAYDPLAELGDAARDTAGKLSDINVPPGFQREFLEGIATAPDKESALPRSPFEFVGPTIIMPPVVEIAPFTPPMPVIIADTKPSAAPPAPPVVITEHHYHFPPGAVVVEGADKPVAVLYDEITAEGRSRARAHGGIRAASHYDF